MSESFLFRVTSHISSSYILRFFFVGFFVDSLAFPSLEASRNLWNLATNINLIRSQPSHIRGGKRKGKKKKNTAKDNELPSLTSVSVAAALYFVSSFDHLNSEKEVHQALI